MKIRLRPSQMLDLHMKLNLLRIIVTVQSQTKFRRKMRRMPAIMSFFLNYIFRRRYTEKKLGFEVDSEQFWFFIKIHIEEPHRSRGNPTLFHFSVNSMILDTGCCWSHNVRTVTLEKKIP